MVSRKTSDNDPGERSELGKADGRRSMRPKAQRQVGVHCTLHTQLVPNKYLPHKRQPGVEGRALGLSATDMVCDVG